MNQETWYKDKVIRENSKSATFISYHQ